MKPLFYSLSVFTILLIVGCATPTPTPPVKYTWIPRVEFDEKEYEPYGKAGKNKVKVQGLLKTLGGEVKYSAGNPVFLSPVTSYSTQYFETMILAAKGDKVGLATLADERLYKYFREGVCDGTGNYIFENVPDGEYYVYTYIQWSTGQSYLQLQGGSVYAKIKVEAPFTENTIVLNSIGRTALSSLNLREAGVRDNIPGYKP